MLSNAYECVPTAETILKSKTKHEFQFSESALFCKLLNNTVSTSYFLKFRLRYVEKYKYRIRFILGWIKCGRYEGR
jgi:hypothetical protein